MQTSDDIMPAISPSKAEAAARVQKRNLERKRQMTKILSEYLTTDMEEHIDLISRERTKK